MESHVEDWTDEEKEALKKLAARLESDPSFSDHDARIIKEMIQCYMGIRAWGRIARIIVVGLAMLAAAVTAWEVLSQKVRQWLGS